MLKRLFFILLLPVYAFCQNFPAKPSNYVTDEANILGPDEEYRLNAILKAFEDSTSIQLFVYTNPSLNGAVMSDLCQQLFHQWKIGNKKTNNGVLIAIFVNDHKFRIHTGYGMEGILPDLRTKRIQDEIMRSRFKENNYFMGLIEGVNKIVYYSKHEFKPGSEKITPGKNSLVDMMFYIIYGVQLFMFFIVCLIIFSNKRIEPKRRNKMLIIGVILLCIPFIGIIGQILLMVVGSVYGKVINNYGNTGHSFGESSSSWSSSSSSDYSSGSSSDFGGGGGGDSGGGGSDSSW